MSFPHFSDIESIEIIEEVVDVYDLEVENTHCFFANGILVHNCLAGPLAHKASRHKVNNSLLIPGGEYDESDRSFSDPDKVNEAWIDELSCYFKDRFYIEIQDHNMWEQAAYNNFAIQFAKKKHLPLVLTCDSHYLREEDKPNACLVSAMQKKIPLPDAVQELQDWKAWVREADEMYKLAESLGVQEAFWNTQVIADQCNVELTLGKYQMPEFDITTANDYQKFLEDINANTSISV